MTAPPSSPAPQSTADTVPSPQPSSSTSKPFLTSPTPSSSAIRSPMFSAQPLLGKPINSSAPPPPSHGILYPVGASVHRGFPVRSSGGVRAVDQLVTVANPASYLRSSSPMAVMNFAAAMAAASQPRPYLYGGVEHTAAAAAASHGMRPPPPQGQQQAHPFVVPRPGVSRGASVPAYPKVTSLPAMPPAPEHSDTKERDKSIDDAFVMIHGRKVRVVDDGSCSLYSLCRSWIQSGLTPETHPNVGEGVKLLPKPLPPSIVEETLNKKVDDKGDEDFQEDEHGDSVDQLSTQELLGGHIRRAKRVRARFRSERLLRIERYKQRLSLLLPAPNDVGQTNTTTGNS
ncbi:uncharacterized protein LOC110095078 [Dendrobium catenatum]|uniref:uncharacterized protein LOC110095078 n=1 Tax=Dendrobium catenatum TaxID=906689 RepID=UPI0009F44B07|nr:uncharacterized protein LOC110095078 [Dendrobium catenatum]